MKVLDIRKPVGAGRARFPARHREIVSMAFVLMVWAGAFPAIEVAVRAVNPAQLAELRFLTGATVLGAWILWRRPSERLDLNRKRLMLFALAALLGYVTYHVGLNAGEQLISASAAGFLVATVPLFTTAFAVLFLGERPPGSLALGILFGIAGAAIIGAGQGSLVQAGPGAALVLLASAAEGAMFVVMKPLLARISPLHCTVVAMTLAAAFLIPWLPGAVVALVSRASPDVVLCVAYLALFPTAIAYVLWSNALARLPASTTAATLYVMPLLTAFASWIILAETPRVTTLTGGLVSLTGVWFAQSKRRRREQMAPSAPSIARGEHEP